MAMSSISDEERSVNERISFTLLRFDSYESSEYSVFLAWFLIRKAMMLVIQEKALSVFDEAIVQEMKSGIYERYFICGLRIGW